MQYNFEWDPAKAGRNKAKHKVSFETASTVFNDAGALTLFDYEHSDESDDRWITLGISARGNLLVLIHTYKDISDEFVQIRIISARKATKKEKLQYQSR